MIAHSSGGKTMVVGICPWSKHCQPYLFDGYLRMGRSFLHDAWASLPANLTLTSIEELAECMLSADPL